MEKQSSWKGQRIVVEKMSFYGTGMKKNVLNLGLTSLTSYLTCGKPMVSFILFELRIYF